jgi:hypothetical protein
VEESTVVNEWIATGEARGRAEASRALLLRLGTKKFGRGPSDAQRAAIDAMTEPAHLSRLADRVLDVTSWDELLAPPSP